MKSQLRTLGAFLVAALLSLGLTACNSGGQSAANGGDMSGVSVADNMANSANPNAVAPSSDKVKWVLPVKLYELRIEFKDGFRDQMVAELMKGLTDAHVNVTVGITPWIGQNLAVFKFGDSGLTSRVTVRVSNNRTESIKGESVEQELLMNWNSNMKTAWVNYSYG